MKNVMIKSGFVAAAVSACALFVSQTACAAHQRTGPSSHSQHGSNRHNLGGSNVIPAPNGNTGFSGIGLPKPLDSKPGMSTPDKFGKTPAGSPPVIPAANGNTGFTGLGLPKGSDQGAPSKLKQTHPASLFDDAAKAVGNGASAVVTAGPSAATALGNALSPSAGNPKSEFPNLPSPPANGGFAVTAKGALSRLSTPAGSLGSPPAADNRAAKAKQILGTPAGSLDVKPNGAVSAARSKNILGTTTDELGKLATKITPETPKQSGSNNSSNDKDQRPGRHHPGRHFPGPNFPGPIFAGDAVIGGPVMEAPAIIGDGGVAPAAVNENPALDPAAPIQPSAAVASNVAGAADLVLEDVRLAAPATRIAGPAYAVKFRNQGTQAAGKFLVGIFTQASAAPRNDGPRAIVEIPSLAAGQAAEVVLRLPRPAFTRLVIALDVANTVAESDKANNMAAIDRAALEGAAN